MPWPVSKGIIDPQKILESCEDNNLRISIYSPDFGILLLGNFSTNSLYSVCLKFLNLFIALSSAKNAPGSTPHKIIL